MTIPSVPTRGRTLDYAASVYDLLEPLCLLNKQAEYDQSLLQALAPQPADTILDLGCGTGLFCALVAQHLDPDRGGSITGIDAAGKMIAHARKKRGLPHCRFEAMAAEQLNFADGSFDSVVSSLFYHHVPLDLKKRSLQEAFRVLKPGGKLVLADFSPSGFCLMDVIHAAEGRRHPHPPSRFPHWHARLRSAGLRVRRFEDHHEELLVARLPSRRQQSGQLPGAIATELSTYSKE